LAAESLNGNGDGIECKFIPRNPAMKWLHGEARSQLCNEGRFLHPATSAISDYRFALEASYRGFLTRTFFGDTQRVEFEIVDGPGGALLPNHEPSADNLAPACDDRMFLELIERVQKAEAMILCVDATDEQASSAFFISLVKILSAVPGGRLPCRHLLILLTKAERHFAGFGARAEEMARSTDPWPHVLRMMTKTGLGNLLQAVSRRRAVVASAWVSAHGFLPDGQPNMDASGGRLRAVSGTDAALRYWQLWRPFQLLDPLVYLTTREPGNLWFLELADAFLPRN
jgi:hypothetical protein